MADPRKEVIIDYTNWRGERSVRRIFPLGISFENNEWHPETSGFSTQSILRKARIGASHSLKSIRGSQLDSD